MEEIKSESHDQTIILKQAKLVILNANMPSSKAHITYMDDIVFKSPFGERKKNNIYFK